MKVSTRGRYALRMMLDIATNDHGEPVRIKDQGTPGRLSPGKTSEGLYDWHDPQTD